MKQLKDSVVFTVHPPVEFVYALNFVANEVSLYKFYSEFSFVPSDEFKLLIEEMKHRLSRFVQNELLYFFSLRDMTDILGRILLENRDVKDISDFIAFLEQMDEEALLSLIMRQILYGKNAEAVEPTPWKGSENIFGNVKQLITDMDDRTDEDKEKFLEWFENPSELKSRLCFLLAQFYEKAYKPIEVKILTELSTAKKRYEKLFNDDPAYFNSEYLGKLLDKYDIKFVLHISYFTQIRVWMFNIKPYGNTQLVSLGIHSEHYPRKVYIKSKVQKFVKILSDMKRFEIVERLGKRPYYVHELSGELELTSPTVCYHLNAMLDLNLVSVDRENNKTFYALNKVTVKELLNYASEILLDDKN